MVDADRLDVGCHSRPPHIWGGREVSTAAMPVHVALVDNTGTVDSAELAHVAGALNEQVQADFAPVWRVAATVGAYPSAPAGTWRVELDHDIGAQGALGFHSDEHHQPFAKIDVDVQPWSATASHEIIEMLGDPWGNRLHTAAALPGWEGTSPRVRYLVELCDPCEAFSYPVGGVDVSDFLLPAFYRSSPRATAGYSHLGRLTEPLEIADGGYITFVDPANGDVWQRFVQGGQVRDKNWGPQDLGREMLRERADDLARQFRGGGAM
jgi:hypothetical protein